MLVKERNTTNGIQQWKNGIQLKIPKNKRIFKSVMFSHIIKCKRIKHWIGHKVHSVFSTKPVYICWSWKRIVLTVFTGKSDYKLNDPTSVIFTYA